MGDPGRIIRRIELEPVEDDPLAVPDIPEIVPEQVPEHVPA